MAESGEPTTKLAKVEGGGSIRSVADTMVKSRFFGDVKNLEQAMVKLKLGEELGLDAMTAMSQIFFINGKPAMTAGLQARLIKQSGKYRYEVREKTTKLCKLEFFEYVEDTNDDGKKRKQWRSIGYEEFGEEDAKMAGLLNGPNAANYKKFPKNMYFARAITNGFRTYTPDAIPTGGTIYLPEELDQNVKVDYSSGDGVVTEIEGEVVTVEKTRLATVLALIQATNSDLAMFLKQFDVDDPAKLTNVQLDEATRLLELKKNAK
jgi:hypothetical protein